MKRTVHISVLLTALLWCLPGFAQQPIHLKLDEAGLEVIVNDAHSDHDQKAHITITRTRPTSSDLLLFESFLLNDPPRVVLDLNHEAHGKSKTIPLEHPLFSSLRLGMHDRTTRIVVDLKDTFQQASLSTQVNLQTVLGVDLQVSNTPLPEPAFAPSASTETVEAPKSDPAAQDTGVTSMNEAETTAPVAERMEPEESGAEPDPLLKLAALQPPPDQAVTGSKQLPKRPIREEDFKALDSWCPYGFDSPLDTSRISWRTLNLALVGLLLCTVFLNRRRIAQLFAPAPVTESPGMAQLRKLLDAYSILGCDESFSDEEIKAKYRHLAKVFHADKLQAQDLAPELITYAGERFQQIQDAYEAVKRERGFN